MVKFYATKVKLGYMTIEQVPERYREEVDALLAAA